MRSILLFGLLVLFISFPMVTISASHDVPGETLVTMEITGMT